MFQVEGEDLIRALKKFKSLAKQDLLTSEMTNDPVFWRAHAEARRNEYTRLINLIENSGVEKACVYAFMRYQESGIHEVAAESPLSAGCRQALELFFKIIGSTPGRLEKWLQERRQGLRRASELIDDGEVPMAQEQI
ncbi:MAG TPA: hypothetical protein GXZ98_10750 [Firmicutes bacterium]|jgi:hypothetical protein|nr:hypothetical protein [Bacillota bacterium]